MSRDRIYLMVFLLITTLFVGGCWDRREIENRGVVLGTAVDMASPEAKGNYDLERAFQQVGNRRYHVSYELRKLKAASSGEKSSGDAENIVFSAEGESFFAATRAINAESFKGLFFEDLQILLISEDVARDGVREIFDFFARDPEMRRRAKVYITKGKAEDLFQQKPKLNEINSVAIAKLAANAEKTPTFATMSELGYVSESLHAKRGFSVPMLYLEKGKIKAAGTAIFNREGRMVGMASEDEVIGGKIWRRSLKQGLVIVPNPDKPETIVAFELFEAKITVKPDFSGDTVRFIVAGEFVGNLGESVPIQGQAFSDECLNKIAQAVAAEYTNHAYAAWKKSQTVKADALDLGDMIYRRNPQYWNKIKDRWEEEIFPTVTADVNIKVRIGGSGVLL